MLYQKVVENEFVFAFDEANRSNQFSVDARRELFAYYEDIAYDMPGGIEFDVIGICCDWAEYTESEIVEQFGYLLDVSDVDDGEEYIDALIEYLRDNGSLIVVEHIGEPDTYLFSE